MTLTDFAALVMPKKLMAHQHKRRARRMVRRRRPTGRQDLGYHVFTDSMRPIPWECNDGGALLPAEAHKVLDMHQDANHAPGTCALTRAALAALEAERAARRIRATRINAPTVRAQVADAVASAAGAQD